MKKLLAWLVLVGGVLVASSSYSQFTLSNAFPVVGNFGRPVDLQDPDDGTNRVFVVTKGGIIYVLQNDFLAPEKKVFLDLTAKVWDFAELGMLSMAFHPDFINNGFFYVFYNTDSASTGTVGGAAMVSRFKVSATNPDSADASSELNLLDLTKHNYFHTGGRILFGPNDGYLYVSLGDDGSSLFSQDSTRLMGKLIRIDVDNPSGGNNYGIPPDNPWAGNTEGIREEIYAFGFRNPWRFSIDPPTNRIWLADVGLDDREEVDIVEPGLNYGWPYLEGSLCYFPQAGPCDTLGRNLELPLLEYPHGVGFAVMGGVVYRSSEIPELVGWYLYADFVTGKMWALKYDGVNPPQNHLIMNDPLMSQINSFGVDRNNKLFIMRCSGRIYKLTRTPATAVRDPIPTAPRIEQNYPNPFNPQTTISYALPRSATVEIRVFDVDGRLIETLVDRTVSAGPHSVRWSGNDASGNSVASGIYFYQLVVDGAQIESKRMVLLK